MSESFDFVSNELDIIQELPSGISTNGHYEKNSLQLSVLHRDYYVSNNLRRLCLYDKINSTHWGQTKHFESQVFCSLKYITIQALLRGTK